jgi:hypothetical protein
MCHHCPGWGWLPVQNWVDLFTPFCQLCLPHSKQYSIILIDSLSHLGGSGLESYMVDMVKIMSLLPPGCGRGLRSSLTSRFRCRGGGVQRAIVDLNSWLLGSTLGSGVGLWARGASSGHWLLEGGTEVPGGDDGRQAYCHPTLLNITRRKVFYYCDWSQLQRRGKLSSHW